MTILTTPSALSKIELIAVITAVTNGQPKVITVGPEQKLPSGPLEFGQQSLESSLRDWINTKTGHPVGFLEQLYTFSNRLPISAENGTRTISVSYLGLVREQDEFSPNAEWHDFSWFLVAKSRLLSWLRKQHKRRFLKVASIRRTLSGQKK